MKRTINALSAGFLSTLLLLSSCASSDTTNPQTTTDTTPTTAPTAAVDAAWNDDDHALPSLDDATIITLSDGGSAIDGDGASATSSGITITAGGVYVVRGNLSDGQLRVEATADDVVQLVLDGAVIHSETTAPLFVRKSKKTILTLSDGSENRLSDSVNAVFEDTVEEEPSGALFSKSDLTINGGGSLTVNAAFNDGIVSRDGLKIVDGTITVTAADDAVMGRDYVLIGGGSLKLTVGGDGIKSTNDASSEVGTVTLEDGSVTIQSEADGVQAQSALCILGGTLEVTAGGGHQNGSANSSFDYGWGMDSVDSSSVGKGLKAGSTLQIAGGTITLDAADDALHSNDTLLMSGGVVTAAAGDDGVHADNRLTIDGGQLTVSSCYEGLEAASIVLNDGEVSITASDDGINASSGSSETSGDFGGRGGMGGDPFAADGSSFAIHGGTLYVDASGDGLDSNGSATMTGGTVWVVGPSNNGNGTFDYASSFDISGGTLIAIGSSGMAQTPSSNTMNSIVWGGCTLTRGETFAVTAADGSDIASIVSTRSANWAYVTSPAIKQGESYTLIDGYESRTITHSGGQHAIGYSGQMGGPGGMGGGMERPGGGMGRPGGFY